MEERYYKLYRILAVGSGLVCILMLSLMGFDENFNEVWRQYQLQFRQMRVISETALPEQAVHSTEGIQQIELKELGIIDRCTSCHTAIEDSSLSQMIQPFKKHSGDYLSDHPIQKFGCTTCHRGNGRILAVQEICSVEIKSSIYDLKYTHSACGKCHLAVYNPNKSVSNADQLYKGLSVFKNQGCLGCHKVRGVGGILGPDLTSQGKKMRGAYNFRYISGEPTIPNWLKEHFQDPEKISPGSEMLSFKLPEPDIDNLVILTLGLYPLEFPVTYHDLNMIKDFNERAPISAGKESFSLFCSACHHPEGKGRDYRNFSIGVPALNNPDFLALASRDFLAFTIWEGRAYRKMNGWSPRLSGLYGIELHQLTDFILDWQPDGPRFEDVKKAPGNSTTGRFLYLQNCGFCHGEKGFNGIAPTLNNQDFLSIASDEYIFQTVIRGRSNTAMPSWSRLSEPDMASLLKFMRSWQTEPARAVRSLPAAGNIREGTRLFDHLCVRCHGRTGAGGIGPAILNPDFLKAAGNEFLYQSIAGGRGHTSMIGWSSDLGKSEKMASADLANIIAFMRTMQDSVPRTIYPGESLGNPQNGGKLFEKHCSECHGYNGEGVKAPALNNQEFLNAATNGYILGTISLGRENTQMPSWGRGSEKHPALSGSQRWDVVSFIRSWQKLVIQKPWINSTP